MKDKERRIVKNNKGITLVALVVTIIIVLILAAITLETLSGGDGLLRTVVGAGEKSDIASEKEILNVSATRAKGKDKYGNIRKKGLEEAISENSNGENITVEEYSDEKMFFVTFEDSGRMYKVDKTGETEYLGYKEKLSVFQERRKKEGAGVSKKDVQKYMNKQKKEAAQPLNNAFAEAFAKLNLKQD